MATYFGGARGKRRQFKDNLNLVPFIDLFSTIIIFLLLTAVWDQLAALKTNLGQPRGSSTVSAPEEIVEKVEAKVRMTVTEDYIELFDAGQTQRVPIQDKIFDLLPVETFVASARQRHPESSDVIIEASDRARYEHIIVVMDQAIGQNFTDVVITGMKGGRN